MRPRLSNRLCPASVWIMATFVLLGFTWVLSSPPGAGVDETSHHIRVVGLAHGQLLGEPVDPARPLGNLEGEQLQRVNAEAGTYRIPGNSPPPQACNVFEAWMPFVCPQLPLQADDRSEVSLHARYLPGAYVVPAIFARFGTTMWRSVVLARTGLLLQNALLLYVVVRAFAALRQRGGGLTTAGAALAALSFTPLLAFLSGTLSPSSTETFAVAAFAVSLVALARVGSKHWLWTAVATAVMACWARDLGVAAVLLSIIVVGLLEPELRRWWSTAGRERWWATSVVAVSALGATAWQVALKQPITPSFASLAALWRELGAVPGTLRDAVGLVGWLNVPLDPVIQAVWTIGWIVASWSVARSGSARLRLVLFGEWIVVVLLSVGLSLSMRAAGFGMQARFLLPVLAVMVLTAIASPTNARPLSAPHVRLVLGWCALGHGSTLLVWAHRNANGLASGPIDLSGAAWSPPGGWLPPVVMGSMACLMLVCTPLGDRRGPGATGR